MSLSTDLIKYNELLDKLHTLEGELEHTPNIMHDRRVELSLDIDEVQKELTELETNIYNNA